MKHLIKTFSLHEIENVAMKKGWKIPSSKRVKNSNIEYNVVWVNDLPLLDSDKLTHGCIYVVDKDRIEVCNKDFKHHIVVIDTNK